MSVTKKPALLMVMMDPPASLEEEFNDWYDTEHFPQRVGLPGFVSASRWVCIDGWPRWLALYDLESDDALHSDAYLGVSGPQSTPWSRRLLPRTVGRSRVVATAIDGHGETRHEPSGTSRLLVMSVPLLDGKASPEAVVSAVRESLMEREDLLQLRAFVEEGSACWILAAFDGPVTTSALAAQIGRPCGSGIKTFNLYISYQRCNY
jgi:hypothetical protein